MEKKLIVEDKVNYVEKKTFANFHGEEVISNSSME